MLLFEGLKHLLEPKIQLLSQLNQKTTKLVYEFTLAIFKRHFGLILRLCKEKSDPSYYLFSLAVISAGLQSTNSIALLQSIAAVSCFKG